MFSYDSAFAPNTLKSYHSYLKWVWNFMNLILPFKAYIKICNEIAIKVLLWGVFEYIYDIYTPKNLPKSYRSSLKGVCH